MESAGAQSAHETFTIEEPAAATPKEYKKAFPVFIVTITIVQILVTYLSPANYWYYVAYDPFRRHQVWRFFTIIFVHQSAFHLWSNLILQMILGALLEIIHHWKRIAIIYFAGVLGGSLFITVFTPMIYCVGASAGVYALLFAHLATIILDWNEMDRKYCRLISLLTYICLDIGLSFVHAFAFTSPNKSNISHAGHFGGALTGFLVSVLVLKNFEKRPWERRVQKICMVLLILIFLVLVIINVAWPSHYFKSEFNTDYEYSHGYIVVKEIHEDPHLKKECEADEKCQLILKIYRKIRFLNKN